MFFLTAELRRGKKYNGFAVSGDLSGIARRAKPEASLLFGFLGALVR
jgi:hypothetical protein